MKNTFFILKIYNHAANWYLHRKTFTRIELQYIAKNNQLSDELKE